MSGCEDQSIKHIFAQRVVLPAAFHSPWWWAKLGGGGKAGSFDTASTVSTVWTSSLRLE